eukprot:4339075-Pyramimonas_sp.AAC.2
MARPGLGSRGRGRGKGKMSQRRRAWGQGCAARGQHGRIAGQQRGCRDAVRLQPAAQVGLPPALTGGRGAS